MKIENIDRATIVVKRINILSSYLEKLNHSGITAVKPGSGITLILNNSDGTSLGAVVSEESRAAITNIVTDSLQRELEALEKELSTL